MNWFHRIQNKLQVALMLVIVLMLVFGKNVIEKDNVSELSGSFSSVYEDRLLVESYIYKLSDHLYQKKIMFDQCNVSVSSNDLQSRVALHNVQIDSLIHYYESTRLTEEESNVFSSLRKSLAKMTMYESQFIKSASSGIDYTYSLQELNSQFQIISRNLHQLSVIQIAEAKKLNDDSKRIVAGITVLTHFEQAMLVVIGLIIIALILSSQTIGAVHPVNSRLN